MTTETSLRASGMREVAQRLRIMAGNLFGRHADNAAKCYRTAADVADDRANYLLKEGRYAPKDQR